MTKTALLYKYKEKRKEEKKMISKEKLKSFQEFKEKTLLYEHKEEKKMKKIINKKLYDTETAKMIASWSNGLGKSDFRGYEENLFLKKTGEFFLYGEGGGLSPYAERRGDGWGYGEKITPLTEEEAREWAETHMEADEYLKIWKAEE